MPEHASADTIYALSSGALPSGVAVVRVSGPNASEAIRALAGALPEPRRTSLRTLCRPDGEWLDRGLVLWFPGPRSATGEDCAEFHCHGGRAVVRAIESALGDLPGFRSAEAGEFTRRAFLNGRMDLIEAEGLGDLLAAETELQRAVLARTAGGSASAKVADWRESILAASAAVEQELDFSDDDQEGAPAHDWRGDAVAIAQDMQVWLSAPSAERLRDGMRVVLAGPPNAGKSSLFNAILDEAAAIVSPIAGTTRDAIERPVAIGGVPFVLVDTAGLRAESADEIERIGIARADAELARADIVLWLGPEGRGPADAIEVASKSDLPGVGVAKGPAALSVSAETREGLGMLLERIETIGRAGMPKPGQTAVSHRQRERLSAAHDALAAAARSDDLLLAGELLRTARHAMDAMLGNVSTEDMLDALFGRFCIGK